ncbi:MAG: hypothetical protein A2X36_11455 [Elusimicrobia bacterium GWA2_69_24]|nr:MAG: hypothetical protein A2X36_11455 [Elusimicrobia bacterium GWA2_69_24]HBL16201.1 hypothetical protein [Elusimicrobiota bacterium]
MGRRLVLHIWTLSAFAFTQPVLDLLGRQPDFFLAHRTRLPDAVILLTFLCGALPAALTLLRSVWGRVFPGTRRAADLLIIGGLAAAAIMPFGMALRRQYGLYVYPLALAVQWWPIFWVTVLGSGAGAAALYARRPAARAFVTALSPALLVFPALFLWRIAPALPAAGQQAFPAAPAGSGRAGPPPPIVFVVFDGLSLSAMQDERARIDPVRYPNFAALAETGFWFPEAKSAAARTIDSVPVLLSGMAPPGPRGPPSSGRSLFTLIAGDYDFNVRELVTRACPESLCGIITGRSSLAERIGLLLEDSAVAALQHLLPEELTGDLPDISGRWKGFIPRDPCARKGAFGGRRSSCADERVDEFRSFLSGLVAGDRPMVHFMHVYLPHRPASYLPSGRHYRFEEPLLGVEEDRWTGPEELALLAQQRYLLQVGFTDRLLGELTSRLRETGLFDAALVVVTSDHGFNFWPGGPAREPAPADPEDVRRVPLLVKLPGQSRGGAVLGEARGIDVLPTILAAAGRIVPAELPGRALLPGGRGTAAAAGELPAPGPALRRKLRLFGTGALRPDGLFRFGPDGDLVGRPVSAYQSGSGGVELRWDAADASFVPAYVRGTIAGRPAGGLPRLAVAVDGTIWAVGRAFPWKGRETGFAVLVPESALRTGVARVEVFELSGAGDGRRLRLPGGSVKLAEETPVGRRLIY